MISRAPTEAQERFHGYVAGLLVVTIPLVGVVEFIGSGHPRIPAQWAGYAALTLWSVHVARFSRPNAVPLVLATMWYTGVLVVIEEMFGVQVTTFDFTSTYGLVLLMSVLAGTLAPRHRLAWSGGLAFSVSMWVVIIGSLRGEDAGTVSVRALIGVAGVIFTTALVSMLFDQLADAVRRHDRSARLQDAIARCSEALLVNSDASAIGEAVKALFEATDADYAYVDRTVEIDGEPGWEIIADADEAEMTSHDWARGKYSLFPDIYQTMLGGRAFVVHTRELTEPLRSIFETDGIQSEVMVPIFVGAEFRGSVGFIQFREDRRWSEVEIQTLWRAAHMIGAYWGRLEAAAELRASNESKDRLLASVSHEIRTPLTAIVGLSEEIASASGLGADELDELNSIIAVQSRELAELVEDLLVASRADFGNLSIKPETIDLRAQVDLVVQGLRESHRSSKILAVEGEGVLAWADSLRVRQILRNLLTNAIKYGGDRVTASVVRTDEMGCIVVSDDGSGVTPEEAPLIFERYYRSAHSPTQPGSVGIGLSVSRQLAEMMDGTLEYVAADAGPGFELRLPLAASSTDHGQGTEPEVVVGRT
ncbi:MAG: sensor histidine kinase [Acidimicrobiia bacterium]